MKLSRKFFALAVLLGSATPAFAQESSPSLEDLLGRIEALERQNRYLESQLEVRGATPATSPANGADPFQGASYSTAETAAIRSVVAEILEEEKAVERAKENSGHVVGSDLSMSATWKDGLEISTKNKDFRVHIGGRTQFDTGWYSVDPTIAPPNINNPYGDGFDFRRTRLRIDGTMYEVIEWACEYDFVNAVRVGDVANTGSFDVGVTAFTDLWVQVNELPLLGKLRIGNQKEGIGFEHIVSSRFLPFMERSFNQDTFYGGTYNGFTPGIQSFQNYGEEDGVFQLGLFKPVDNVFDTTVNDGDYSVVTRLTNLLYYMDDGNSLLHVGASFKQASTVGGRTRFRTRDAIRTGIAPQWPIPADAGNLFGDDMQWINAELAGVYGSWTLQSEYLVSSLQDARATALGPNVGNLVYHGGYVQVLYFLTGEHDHYNKKTGVFERVKPHENFFMVEDCDGNRACGLGAWQVGARYNYLDLNDEGINGGILHNLTAGLNWYLNPNLKFQFDYSATNRDAPLAGTLGDGWAHGFGARCAFDF